jgi:hypothetical protein
MAKYIEVKVTFMDGYSALVTLDHKVPLDELTTFGVGSKLARTFYEQARVPLEELLPPEEQLDEAEVEVDRKTLCCSAPFHEVMPDHCSRCGETAVAV